MNTPAAAKRALSEEQKAELKEAFDLFDTEKSGMAKLPYEPHPLWHTISRATLLFVFLH